MSNNCFWLFYTYKNKKVTRRLSKWKNQWRPPINSSNIQNHLLKPISTWYISRSFFIMLTLANKFPTADSYNSRLKLNQLLPNKASIYLHKQQKRKLQSCCCCCLGNVTEDNILNWEVNIQKHFSPNPCKWWPNNYHLQADWCASKKR